MKRNLLVIYLAFSIFKINAQSNSLGKVSGSVGFSFGASYPTIELSQNSPIAGETIPGEVISINTFYPMEINLGIAKPISLGVAYTPTHFNFIGEV